MPQLNPAPWLYISLTLWLITTLLLMPQILHFPHQTNPSHHKNHPPKTPLHWKWQ